MQTDSSHNLYHLERGFKSPFLVVVVAEFMSAGRGAFIAIVVNA
jgi:hypothetical protein